MADPFFESVTWAKSKYVSVVLSSNGKATGFVHLPGFAFRANDIARASIDNTYRFLESRNQSSSARWLLGAASEFSFEESPETSFPCSIILLLGVGLDGEKIKVFYYEMRNDLGSNDITKAILCSSNEHKLIKTIFGPTLKCCERDMLNFIYLNQISGLKFKTWVSNSSIVEFNGKRFHQLGSGPDSWLTRGWINPKIDKLIDIYTAPSILKRRSDMIIESGVNIFEGGQLKII